MIFRGCFQPSSYVNVPMVYITWITRPFRISIPIKKGSNYCCHCMVMVVFRYPQLAPQVQKFNGVLVFAESCFRGNVFIKHLIV